MPSIAPSTAQFYDRASARMGTLAARADRLMTDISTQKKLQAPSDDVVAYQRLQGLARAGSDTKVWDANLDLAGSVLAQGDTTIASMTTQVQRASELMLRANNSTLSPVERKATGAELTEILRSLVELANTQDTRGQPLFGGTDGKPAVALVNGAYEYSEGTPAAIPVGQDQSVQPNELASRLFTANGKDTLAVIAALAATLSTGEALAPGDGDTAISDLKAADDQLVAVRSSMGARATRVDLLQAQSTEIAADRETERAGLEDTDMAAAIADLQKTMTILQATQASFTKLQGLSLFDYLR